MKEAHSLTPYFHDRPLFLHASLIGAPLPEYLRAHKDIAYEKLYSLLPKDFLMPAFTYSFGDGEFFDLRNSHPVNCGGVVDYLFRNYCRGEHLPIDRTHDPMFSVFYRGCAHLPRFLHQERESFDCFGPDSVWAWLVESDAQIGFLNCSVNFCTFIHHVEQSGGVTYRYPKGFIGRVIAGVNTVYFADVVYWVKPQDDSVVTDLRHLFALLDEVVYDLGEFGLLHCYSARQIMEVGLSCLKVEPFALLREPA